MLDRKSPLTGKDFEVLFGSDSTVSQLKRVARKAGLASYDKMTKAEMVEAIESTLQSKNIREPIRLHISAQRAVRKVSVNNNNNYPNNLNVNNTNGNGVRNNNNLRKIANESNNLNRGNGNRNGNGNNLAKIANESRNLNRGNLNRGNGNRGNGNRGNGNRGNERPPVNRTTARYVNAMLRKPNARRNEDLARVLSAARNTGGGSTQNLSRIIEAVRRKPSTDGSTATMLNKLMRAKTSGNSNALQRAMKEIEELKRRPVAAPAARVNNKQQKLAELEKYAVNKASKLGDQRLQFMNEAQKYVNGYKNGKFNSISAKARITARYEEIYKKQVKAASFNEGVSKLQREKVNTIQNTKIKSEAMERLEEYKKTGSQSAMNDIIQLKKLDEQLGIRQEKVDILFNKNRRYLNAVRDEVLKTKPYNLKNGLAKLDKIIEEKEKEIEEKKRDGNINNLIKNAKYEKLAQNEKNKARRAYMNGGSTLNEVRSALNKLVAENKKRGDNISKLITNDKYKNLNANAKNKAKEKYIKGILTLNQVKQALNNLVAGNTGNNNQPPLSLNNIFAGKVNNIPSLTNANRNKLNKEKNNNIKTKLKKVTESRNTIVKKTKERNATIASLRDQLAKGGLSNNKKRELENEIKNEMSKRETLEKQLTNITEQLGQAQRNRETAIVQANANRMARNEAISAASEAVLNVERTENTYKLTLDKLNEQINKVTEIEAKLEEKTKLTNAERTTLQNQLFKARSALAIAQKETQNAKENAEAAVAKSRRLVAEAGEAANKATMHAAEAESAKLAALAERNDALGKKKEANEAREEANRLRAEANAARKVAQQEAAQSLKNAAEANAEAKRIAAKLENGKKKSEAEISALRNQMQNAFNRRQIELQNVINAKTREFKAYKNQANKIVRNGATREADQRNRIKALESNRNKWQANSNKKTENLKLATQRLAVKNADLLKKIEQIKQSQSNIVRLQKEMNNAKTASNAEKAALKNQYNKETQNLKEQLGKTETQVISATEKLKEITSSRNIIFKELQGRSNTLAQTRNQLTQTQRELNNTKRIVNSLRTNLQKSKVVGKWQGTALGTQLRNTRTKLNNAEREVGIARDVVTGLQRQRQNLQAQRNNLQSAMTGNQTALLGAQSQIGKLQSERNATKGQLKTTQGRLTGVQGELNLTRGQLRQTQQNVGGLKNIKYRQNVYALVNIKNINGKHVMRGGLIPGAERRKLKDEIMNPKTTINRLRQIEIDIRNRKYGANRVAREKRNVNEGGNGRFNFIARDRGTQTRAPPRPNTLGAQTQARPRPNTLGAQTQL
jgi:hypothetical protein